MVELSIVIPTRNRSAQAGTVIAGLAAQIGSQSPITAEIIVVDDASRPAEAAGVRAAVERIQPAPVRLVQLLTHGGVSHARNTGIAAAHGNLIAFVDDDCRPTTGYVGEILAAHARHPEVVIINGDIRAWRDDLYGRFWSSRYNAVFGRDEEDFYAVSGVSSGNFSIKRALLERLPAALFDETLPAREDFDLYLRLQHLGIPCFKSTRIVVLIDCRASLPALLAQHAWYARGEYWLRQRYGEATVLAAEAVVHTASAEAARRAEFPWIEPAVRLAFHLGYHLEAYRHRRDLRSLLRMFSVGPIRRAIARITATTHRSSGT